MCAGREYGAVGRELAGVGANGAQALAVERKSSDARARDLPAVAHDGSCERLHEALGIAGVPVLAHEAAFDEVARQRRFELPQLVLVEIIPLEAVGPAQFPREVLALQLRFRAIDKQMTELVDDIGGTGVLQQRGQRLERWLDQAA